MELRDYLAIIGKRIWLFIIVVAIVTLGTYFFIASQPTTYDASSSISVLVKPSAESEAYYEYDNYYALEANKLLASEVANWFQSPSNIQEIYQKAQLSLPEVKIQKIPKLIDVKTKQPATILIYVHQKEEKMAKGLVEATLDFVKDKIENLVKKGSLKSVDLEIAPVMVVGHQPSVLLNTVIGFVAGLVIGLALVFLVEYLTPQNRKVS